MSASARVGTVLVFSFTHAGLNASETSQTAVGVGHQKQPFGVALLECTTHTLTVHPGSQSQAPGADEAEALELAELACTAPGCQGTRSVPLRSAASCANSAGGISCPALLLSVTACRKNTTDQRHSALLPLSAAQALSPAHDAASQFGVHGRGSQRCAQCTRGRALPQAISNAELARAASRAADMHDTAPACPAHHHSRMLQLQQCGLLGRCHL